MASRALKALRRILEEAEGTPADPRVGSEVFTSWGRDQPFSVDDFSLDTGALLDRLTRAGEVLDRERRDVDHLLAEILATPRVERSARLADARFQSFSLADALLARAGAGDDRPVAALLEAYSPTELSELALEVANQLDLSRHPAALIADLKARAWTAIGESYLEAGDPRHAEHALREGVKHLVCGSGDLLIEAGMLELEADLRLDAGETLEADTLLRQAISRLREARENRRIARLSAKRRQVAERAQAARAIAGRHLQSLN